VRRPLRQAARLWQVLAVLARLLVLPALSFRMRTGGPARMRLAFERLGGAWVKLGQMLALRFDLLPAAYCDELLKLLNAVEPFPYREVCEIVRQELGAPPEVVFRSFEPEPFASASIGQVHRAILPSGEPVAVKVQRPRIREIMQADIQLMYMVTRLLDWSRVFGATRSREVIDEFARWTADELDYLVEARQSVLLYEHARGDRIEHVARVHRGYTTSRVLTSELLVGIPLLDIVTAVRAGDATYLRQLEADGYDLEAIVQHLDWNMLNQVYVYGYFHADLHPANLYVLLGNAIGYVDFGIVGRLPEAVRDSLTRYTWLLFQGDVEGAVREVLRWLAPTAATDAALAREQLVRAHQAFLYELGGVGPVPRGADANPYAQLALDILQTMRRQQLRAVPSLVAFMKMNVTLGTLRRQLAPDYNVPRLARQFFGHLIRQQGAAWLDPRLVPGRVYGATDRVRRAVEFVEFLEAQQPMLAGLIDTYHGAQRGLHALRRRAIGLGMATLVVGAALYLVLADPTDARAMTPAQVPFDWVHPILLAILVVLIVALVDNFRQFGRR
jgi:predicted unusual protein kinase regulating ubiquinone biosynthesis (AarF/ABC1/UbiB family)